MNRGAQFLSAARRIFKSGPSGAGHGITVVVHRDSKQGWVRPMADDQHTFWISGDIVEDEFPRAGVSNVIGISYGVECPQCGETMDCVCQSCDRREGIH